MVAKKKKTSSKEKKGKENFKKKFEEIIDYAKRTGNAKIPRDNPEMNSRYNWMKRQLQRTDIPDDEERQMVERLKEIYGIKRRKEKEDDNWHAMLHKMETYMKTHHTTCISTKDEQHKDLYNWAAHQRRVARKGRLLPERKKKLDEIGFFVRIGQMKHLKKETGDQEICSRGNSSTDLFKK